MKGIILAGGAGTRLYPATLPVNKQLLPVYNKPMVYYPLSTLMLTGIRDVLVISNPEALDRFRLLLGDGSRLGMRLTYESQSSPRGIADAFLVGEQFVDGEPVCLILGDNIFFGHGLTDTLMASANAIEERGGAIVFGYPVRDPQRYGVVELARDGSVVSIEEKPAVPKSHYAVVGLYFYDDNVVGHVKCLSPSDRGELEITDLNRRYLEAGQLRVELLGRGYAWLDTGTHDSLLEASEFVAAIERRQSHRIGCIEEVAFRKGYIGREELSAIADQFRASGYGEYLEQLLEEDHAI